MEDFRKRLSNTHGSKFMRLILLLVIFSVGCSSSAKCKKKNVRYGASSAEVFSDIYEMGIWGKDEKGNGTSGFGSDPKNAKEYIEFLRDFIVTNEIVSVVDLGCGDFQISSQIQWDNKRYIGIDIVKGVIQKNKKRYASSNIKFLCQDITNTALPKADMLICKDVLQHLTNEDVKTFLNSIKGNYKYCLFVNDIEEFENQNALNKDIPRGDHRLIDLTLPPFSLEKLEKVFAFQCGTEKKQVFLLRSVHE